MSTPKPINLSRWIAEHRAYLKPPVCNKRIFPDAEFTVMIVGGPNSRGDYHDDPGEELFYQIEGDMLLKTMQDGAPVDIPIRAGEMFLLPPHVPHSPQRSAGTVGLVVERPRAPDERVIRCIPSTSIWRTSRLSSRPCSSASTPTSGCAPVATAAPSCRGPAPERSRAGSGAC